MFMRNVLTVQTELAPIQSAEMGVAIMNTVEMACVRTMDLTSPIRLASGGVRRGDGTRAAHQHIRRAVAHLDRDRVLYPDMRRTAAMVQSGEIVRAVWQAIGAGGGERFAAEISALERQIACLKERKRRYEQTQKAA